MIDQPGSSPSDMPIVVVTLNPCFDVILEVNDFRPGLHQLGRELGFLPAGKGLNVCRTLDVLGCGSIITGFVGQQSMADFEQAVGDTSITSQLFSSAGHTRRNVTILDPARGEDTHIRQMGLELGKQDLQRMGKKLSLLGEKDRLIVFAGSLPPGVSGLALGQMLSICRQDGARVVVDTSGQNLGAVIKQEPWLIKPNRREFAQLTGLKSRSVGQMAQAGQKLAKEVKNVLLSLGSDGALLIDKSSAIHAFVEPDELAKIKISNTVGCGDALLGAFLAGIVQGRDFQGALIQAVAVAAAAGQTALPAVFDPAFVREIQEHVQIRRLY